MFDSKSIPQTQVEPETEFGFTTPTPAGRRLPKRTHSLQAASNYQTEVRPASHCRFHRRTEEVEADFNSALVTSPRKYATGSCRINEEAKELAPVSPTSGISDTVELFNNPGPSWLVSIAEIVADVIIGLAALLSVILPIYTNIYPDSRISRAVAVPDPSENDIRVFLRGFPEIRKADVSPTSTVRDLCGEACFDLPPNSYYLQCSGRVLRANQTLEYLGIYDGCVVDVVPRLLGGASFRS